MNENTASEATDWLVGSSKMGQLIAAKDWSKSPLGAIEHWPQSLRTALSLCLSSNFPINLIWGPERTQLYNDGYWPICGDKHPQSLGQDFKEFWSSAWDELGDPFERASAGESVFLENQRMFLTRNGYLEEAFFTFAFSPIRDERGRVGGLFHPVTETTQQTLAERRLNVLRDLAESTAEARTIQSACHLSVEALAAHALDLPFVLFYQFDPEQNQAHLISGIGLERDSATCPTHVDLAASSAPWGLAEAMQQPSGQLQRIDNQSQQWDALEWEPASESPQTSIVIPISLPGFTHPWGILIAGVSPRRALDEPYQGFYLSLGQCLIAALAKAHAYEEEQKRAEALAELDRTRKIFCSDISHVLRNPLTLMLGGAEEALMDQDYPLPPQHRQRMEAVQHNGLRVLKLLDMLWDSTCLESDRRVAVVYEPIDLATATVELAEAFRPVVEQAQLRLVVDCSPLSEPIYIDRNLWVQIVLNLLSNALKFTFAGQITVRLRHIDDRIELTVEDTGIGIAAAEIPHLFERFYQVKGARGRTLEGLGIGLSLVQEWVTLHGGSVAVRSTVGEGSCFSVSIPTGCAHLPPEKMGVTRASASTAREAASYVEEALSWLDDVATNREGSKSGQGTDATTATDSSDALFMQSRILLVQADVEMRNYMKWVLSERWQVETATTGAIALEKLQQQLPDLVLADVRTPEIDGLQLLNTLRADPTTANIPVILLAAQAQSEEVEANLELEADDYLRDPFSARELQARVETQLRPSQLRQAQSMSGFKDELLTNVIYELQATLTLILGWARLLQRQPLKAARLTQGLVSIERNALIEFKLVKDLLDVFNILSQKLQLKCQVVDLQALVQDVLATCSDKADAKNIQLVVTMADDLLSDIFADGDRLRQILENLLDNAIKFTPEGGQIHFQLEYVNCEARITIRDTGVGIPADLLPYIFDRFIQARSPSCRLPGEFGVGLAITRHLVELHNGSIKAASDGEGQGATFTVHLPFNFSPTLNREPSP
ncbi:MAG TPA: ATP-binding protein [Stenomitos sp.]